MKSGQRLHGDHSIGTFSNSFEIGFNGYVFILEFAMVNTAGTAHVHSQIVTSVSDAVELTRLLSKAVEEHTKQYGEVTKGSDPQILLDGNHTSERVQ